jgi:hypothetical protein
MVAVVRFCAIAEDKKRQVWLTVNAPTWFDARAYACRRFAALGLYVDPTGIECTSDPRPLPAGAEVEWRGSDYAGQRRLWVRTRDAGGRWRKWGLA